MLNTILSVLYSLAEILVVLLPVLIAVAYITIVERKVMGAMQRRIGPNAVGAYGLLQPFADALKLIVKETTIPQHANKALFFLGPTITLVTALLGWAVIPLGSGLTILDLSLGVIFSLAISSLSLYGTLFTGWSANSKYSFYGAMRASAQMISYELILSTAVLAVIFLSGSYNYIQIIQDQQAIWYIVPLLPLFIVFFISVLAETNRTPFDLAEGESELVGGFLTEHSGTIFVFLFLGEYTSIVLMSSLCTIFFFGGYLVPAWVPSIPVLENFISIQGLVLGIKTSFFCFLFVWIRATLPRLRYDQLMQACWTGILPLGFGLLMLVPSILMAWNAPALVV